MFPRAGPGERPPNAQLFARSFDQAALRTPAPRSRNDDLDCFGKVKCTVKYVYPKVYGVVHYTFPHADGRRKEEANGNAYVGRWMVVGCGWPKPST